MAKKQRRAATDREQRQQQRQHAGNVTEAEAEANAAAEREHKRVRDGGDDDAPMTPARAVEMLPALAAEIAAEADDPDALRDAALAGRVPELTASQRRRLDRVREVIPDARALLAVELVTRGNVNGLNALQATASRAADAADTARTQRLELERQAAATAAQTREAIDAARRDELAARMGVLDGDLPTTQAVLDRLAADRDRLKAEYQRIQSRCMAQIDAAQQAIAAARVAWKRAANLRAEAQRLTDQMGRGA